MCANLNSITGHRKYTVQEYLLLKVLKRVASIDFLVLSLLNSGVVYVDPLL